MVRNLVGLYIIDQNIGIYDYFKGYVGNLGRAQLKLLDGQAGHIDPFDAVVDNLDQKPINIKQRDPGFFSDTGFFADGST